ncbi:chymotrypsin inhibitor-like [Cochliomyia hominivorax]
MAKLFQYIFLVFLSVLIFADYTKAQFFDLDESCGPNQVWTNCGTACPERCGERLPRICTLQCIVGCQCRGGYKLNNRGECVAPQDC